MSLNDTPSSERVQIAFTGRTNTGKSSLINAVTNQNVSIVSDISGTTADPVYKAMELLPIGAVSIIDTAGYDDTGALGVKRIERTLNVLSRTDIAVLVIDALEGIQEQDKRIIELFGKNNIKYITAYNKCDLVPELKPLKDNEIYTSALKNININELKEKIAALHKYMPEEKGLTDGIVKENDSVLLVTPIDESAPKGRLILPQQQVLRDILDKGGISAAVQPAQLKEALKRFPAPDLVITDSQAFEYVNKTLPENIKLTSFSILFARYKGILKTAVKGAEYIERLKDGDTILISEGCTHHRKCGDIGTVKLPHWIENYTKKNFKYEFTSGMGFPEDLKKYALIIHCGGCMLNEREVLNRYNSAAEQNIPIVNYGIIIAYMHGILKRSIEVFPEIL